jgi:MOSC domain-containing protein YiiM
MQDSQSANEVSNPLLSVEMSILHLFTSRGHNFFGHHGQEPSTNLNIEVRQVECVAGRGIRGDRFFDYQDDYKGQITFFSMEVFRDVCKKLGVQGLSPSVVRRNVITEGVDLNELVGKRFRLQGVAFEGVCECKPCYWMDRAISPGAEELLRGRGGLRAKIFSSGVLHLNE